MAINLYDQNDNFVSTYGTIQAAVDAAGVNFTVKIGTGTYVEQVIVDGAGKAGLTIEGVGGPVTIEAPANLAITGASERLACDVRAVITVKNTANVTIRDLTVDGAFAGDTTAGSNGDELSGIAYLKASGKIDDVVVEKVSNSQGGGLFGLQHGSGILVDNGSNLADQEPIVIEDSIIRSFQKSGLLIFNADADLLRNQILGVGASPLTAQNGIQIGDSRGDILGNKISGIAYTFDTFYSSDIIAYETTGTLNIKNNYFTGVGGAHTAGIDLSDIAAGKTVCIENNRFATLDYGVIAYTYDGALGLNKDPLIKNNSFTNIQINGIYLDPELAILGSFQTSTKFIENGSPFADYLAGSNGGDQFQGLNGDDQLVGRAGSDTLNGGNDDDLLNGGEGNDLLDGGNGIDTATYADADGAVTVDLRRTSSQNTGSSGSDKVLRIENVIGSAFNDRLTGNNAANKLEGLDGEDTLFGDNGNDVLLGGEDDDRLLGQNGRDSLTGGAGDDELSGGRDRDLFTFAPNDGDDIVADFQNDVDRLSFAGFGAAFDTAPEFIAAAAADGDDTLITITSPPATGPLSVRLVDFELADLDTSDFGPIIA